MNINQREQDIIRDETKTLNDSTIDTTSDAGQTLMNFSTGREGKIPQVSPDMPSSDQATLGHIDRTETRLLNNRCLVRGYPSDHCYSIPEDFHHSTIRIPRSKEKPLTRLLTTSVPWDITQLPKHTDIHHPPALPTSTPKRDLITIGTLQPFC